MRALLSLVLISSTLLNAAASHDIRLLLGDITVDRDRMSVSVITGSFPHTLGEEVAGGVKMSINYHIELKHRNMLYDDTVKSVRVNRIIYRDFWENTYVVEDSAGKIMFVSTNREAAVASLGEIGDQYIGSRRSIDKNGRYYFRTRLTAQVIEAYPYLNVFFNFIAALRYRVKWLATPVMSGRYLTE